MRTSRPSTARSAAGLAALWRLAIAAVAIVGWWQSGHDLGLFGLGQVGALLLAVGYLALALVDLLAMVTGTGEPAHGLPRGVLASVAAVIGIFYLTGLDGGADEVNAMTTAALPLLVVVDWCVVGRSQNRSRWWHPAVWLVPVAAYLTAYSLTAGFPWQGEFDEPLYAAVLDPGGRDYPLQLVAFAIAACFAVAFLYGLARMKATGSASRAAEPVGGRRRAGGSAAPVSEEAGLSLFAPRENDGELEPEVVPVDESEPEPDPEPTAEPERTLGSDARPVAARAAAPAPPWPLSTGVVPTAAYAATPLPPTGAPRASTTRQTGPDGAGRHSEAAGSGRHSESDAASRPWPPQSPAPAANGHRPSHRETPPSSPPAPDTRPWPSPAPRPARSDQPDGTRNGQPADGVWNGPSAGTVQNGTTQNGTAQNDAPANSSPPKEGSTATNGSWWRPPTKAGERRQLSAPDGVPDNERPSSPPLRPDRSAPEATREMPRQPPN